MDEYSTHLPIIRMCLALLKPKRVLELGAGLYSTKEFLASPVERLTSLETNPDWLERLRAEIADERWTLRFVDSIVPALPKHLDDYDLVFVDCDEDSISRANAIRAVLEKEHPPVIVHDAEYPAYRRVLEQLAENFVVFNEQTPATAVCW